MTAPTAVAVCENVASTSADIVGKDAAKGTCHKCGGSLSRGNPELAKLCGTCGTRFHASDCGKRLAQVGFPYAGHLCPKCHRLCECGGGACVCHASDVRRRRQEKSAMRKQANLRKAAEARSRSASARAALRGSASRESDRNATASAEGDDDGVALDVDDPTVPSRATATLADGHEPTIFLDALNSDEGPVETNPHVWDAMMADFPDDSSDPSADAEADVETDARLASYESGKMRLAEGFATHLEMDRGALHVHAVELLETPGAEATRKRSSFFDDAARVLEMSDAPQPRPVCETSDARAAIVRTRRSAWRLSCFFFVLAFVAWAAAKLWSTSEEPVCGGGAAGEPNSGLWSVPTVFYKRLRVDSWKTSCGWKRFSVVVALLSFAMAWHALCLQGWMGFRFARAYILMWRLERRQAAAAARSVADAKAEALRGSDVEAVAAPVAPRNSRGKFSIWPRRDQRGAEGSDSDESFIDSAQGESAV